MLRKPVIALTPLQYRRKAAELRQAATSVESEIARQRAEKIAVGLEVQADRAEIGVGHYEDLASYGDVLSGVPCNPNNSARSLAVECGH
jgi:hypothetical protein